MKQLIFTLVIFLGINGVLSAQEDDRAKLDNLKYYLSSIKDNVQSMRYYTDSVNVISLLDQIDALTMSVDAELSKVVLPETEIKATEIEITEPTETEQPADDYTWKGDVNKDPQDEDMADPKSLGITKFMPFKNKYNTSFVIEFGVNSLHQGNASPAGILSPEINTGGSWYWDFGLSRRARLGGKNSKVALNYGISYLKNRFKIENDVRLTNLGGNPTYVTVENVKENPKLNVGYINIPISLSFQLSKKLSLKVGGYAGYRIHTVQKFELKVQGEKIEEQRYAGYGLNNWMYGGMASVGIGSFDIIGRYNFSSLFKDNPNYDYNTFMIGTSISIF